MGTSSQVDRTRPSRPRRRSRKEEKAENDFFQSDSALLCDNGGDWNPQWSGPTLEVHEECSPKDQDEHNPQEAIGQSKPESRRRSVSLGPVEKIGSHFSARIRRHRSSSLTRRSSGSDSEMAEKIRRFQPSTALAEMILQHQSMYMGSDATAASPDDFIPDTIRYEIGQELISADHSVPFLSSSQATEIMMNMPLQTPLFVLRTSGEWTCAALKGRRTDRRGRTSLVVQFTKEGRRERKTLRRGKWKHSLRLARDGVVVGSTCAERKDGKTKKCSDDKSKRVKDDCSGCRRLEAEVRRYKHKARKLNGKRRLLAQRLIEVESKLQLAQAQASEEGRLDAVRALSRAAKILKRKNSLVSEERDQLMSKLKDAERANSICAPKSSGGSEPENQCLQDCLDIVVDKMKNLQSDLDTANDRARTAEAAKEKAEARAVASETAEAEAARDVEELRALIDKLRKANELDDAAKQKGMVARMGEMEEDIGRKTMEIAAVNQMLDEKERAIDRLEAELQEAKEELLSYKAKVDAENEADALQRLADQDYFDEEQLLGESPTRSFSLASGSSSQGGSARSFGGLLQRKVSGEHDKDARIAELEKSLSDNALSMSNLRNELVAVTARYKGDETQRLMQIESLEDENEAYSAKLEVLEAKFKQIGGWEEVDVFQASATDCGSDGGSDDESSVHSIQSFFSNTTSLTQRSGATQLSSGTGVTWSSRSTGASPMKYNRKRVGTRIASLQKQVSEIQQALVSKSSPQVQKLDADSRQREAWEAKEREREEEIERLKDQNEMLKTVTRGMLQNFDSERQAEIEELKMRLEAREATIQKLETEPTGRNMLGKKKGGSFLRKKKSSFH